MHSLLSAVRQNASVLIAIASVLISLCSLTYTALTAAYTRRYNRMMIRPYLESHLHSQPLSKDSLARIDWSLINHGLGPAVIRHYEISIDGEPIKTWESSAVQKAMFRAFGTIPSDCKMSWRQSGAILAKDASIAVLSVELPAPSLTEMTKLTDLDEIGSEIKRFKLVVSYESFLGEKFTHET